MCRIVRENCNPHLNERLTRLWAATEAIALGRGGITQVSQATGLSPKTIRVGMRELEQEPDTPVKHTRKLDRIRGQGGGRKRLKDLDPTLIPDLEALIDPVTRGHPESPLCWTSKSTTKLAEQLRASCHAISARKVACLLHQLDYSIHCNRKTREGDSHPDRDAQFQHIHDQVQAFQTRGQPVISVDTKKKQVIGDYKNDGQEWQRKKQPLEVNTHDFPDPQLGKVVPYGVYDLAANQGWVNVGINHDTAEFAIESIRQWWHHMGKQMYPEADELLITADCGGSNGYRLRLWKTQLQKLANETGLRIQVAHFPPGTSKWNKIEHRMFCHITENWRGYNFPRQNRTSLNNTLYLCCQPTTLMRMSCFVRGFRRGRPLTSREVVINLIGSTTTNKGLTIKVQLDENNYELGKKVSDSQLSSVSLEKSEFHGESNYAIIPQTGLTICSVAANR